jgi:hypothetical protein
VIEKEGKGLINELKIGETTNKHFFVNHSELVESNNFKIILK